MGTNVATAGVRYQPGVRLAVVDATTVVRSAIPHLLPGHTVVGAFRDLRILLLHRLDVDLVLIDPHWSGTAAPGVPVGPEAVRSLTRIGYRVCVYTPEKRRHLLVEHIRAGASGIVDKSADLDVLIQTVRAVAQGRRHAGGSLAGLFETNTVRTDRYPALSARQQQVMAGRARGERFDSIAARLFISKKVAEEHWAAVVHKYSDFLADHSAADLERMLGLTPPEVLERIAG